MTYPLSPVVCFILTELRDSSTKHQERFFFYSPFTTHHSLLAAHRHAVIASPAPG